VDASQRRELNDNLLHRSHGSFELVLSPLLLGLIGLWIDRRLGVVPLCTILFAIAGAVGVCVKIFYVFRTQMAEVTEARLAAREQRRAEASAA
jgi:F0F1-type ATP synthase assembly protein I